MKPRIHALRAISATFALETINKWATWAGVVAAVIVAAIWLLAHYISEWWWLTAIPVAILLVAGFAIWLVLRLILKRLRPHLSRSQAVATKQFIEKTKRLLENATTPYPVLAIRVVFDTVLRRKEGLISEVTSDSRGLREEFNKLVREFK